MYIGINKGHTIRNYGVDGFYFFVGRLWVVFWSKKIALWEFFGDFINKEGKMTYC
jgi:hypothetical protein